MTWTFKGLGPLRSRFRREAAPLFLGPDTQLRTHQRGEALVAERSPTPPRTGFDSPRPCERGPPKCLYGLGRARPNSSLKTEEIANKGIGPS
jgi:hypothetical protein